MDDHDFNCISKIGSYACPKVKSSVPTPNQNTRPDQLDHISDISEPTHQSELRIHPSGTSLFAVPARTKSDLHFLCRGLPLTPVLVFSVAPSGV